MFKTVDSKVDFPAQERETLAWWEENGIVAKYLKRNEASEKRFSFIDGPITANNPMGVHHGWGRTYKDLFQRFKTMQGYRQRYQNGFDGQGLWIEVEVEKELGLESKRDIETFGIDKFVELCKERVRKFADVQTWQSVQLGYWMDWDNSYHTMSDENNYTIWHFLKVCHERGWIYEGTDVMPWCPRCGTGLSQHEIVTEGYKEIIHPGLYVRLPLIDRDGETLLVWTTTPWTLTSNTAAYVHPELTYVKARTDDGVYYLLKSRLSELKQEHEVLEEMPGRDLDGLRYRGPFDELPAQRGVEHRVVLFDDVSEREGTGVVHTAPGAGEADFKLSKREGLAVIAPLDEFGVFVDGFGWLTGRSAFDVNDDIYDSLREKGLFYRVEDYSHRYPVCWRCDTELVFRLVDEWFISMDELRDLIPRVTKKITWVPGFGLARELDWLRNMDDWMISKKRYWGLALPIFKCACGHFEVIGSETELEARAVEGWDQFRGNSPHRPWIDAVKVQCPECGKKVSRIRDVGNPWLDAGIVPFSTLGYRDDRAHWRQWFPADLISESFPGQFRNWFYSLLTMSTVLENTEPFRAVFSYAMMRDDQGDEMHKSKGNAIWFEDAAERMGVDSMRWVYIRQRPEANLNFGVGVADGVRRSFLIPLWNVYSFFVTYANIDGYEPGIEAPAVKDRPELDRWIISELNELIAEVTADLERYDPEDACARFESFVGYLSNWYVRRSRRRFWKSETDDDKLAAYSTLYECLVTLSRLLAPFVPFLTETIYQNLARSVASQYESVHLESYPVADGTKIDRGLSEATRLAMRLSSLGRAARSKAGLKVRQPLERAIVGLRSASDRVAFEQIKDQVRDELNVKDVAEMEDDGEVVGFHVEADLSKAGPRFGAQTREVVAALQSLDAREVYRRVSAGRQVQAGDFTLEPDEVLVTRTDATGFASATEAEYTVAVTTAVSHELELEGLARELVHVVQSMRRSAGFDIADRIEMYLTGNADLDELVATHGDYIRQETLSRAITKEAAPEHAFSESHRLNGREAQIGLVRK
jgi:isoleucyl-tRNA synthetase